MIYPTIPPMANPRTGATVPINVHYAKVGIANNFNVGDIRHRGRLEGGSREEGEEKERRIKHSWASASRKLMPASAFRHAEF
jgi:hypothetical protein